MPELGQVQHQDACGLWSDTWDALQDLDFFLPYRGFADLFVDFVIEAFESLLDKLEGGLQIFDHAAGGGLLEAVGFHGLHVDELSPPCEQVPQILGLFVRDWSLRRLNDLAEASEDKSIDLVGFGQEPKRFGKVSNLAWIDDDDGQSCGEQGCHTSSLIPTAGFQNDALDGPIAKHLHHRLMSARVIGYSQRGTTKDLQIKPIFRDIDTNEE
jgi:hypothetical protein